MIHLRSLMCVYKDNIAISVQNVNAMQTALHKYILHSQEHLVSPNSSQVKFQLFLWLLKGNGCA